MYKKTRSISPFCNCDMGTSWMERTREHVIRGSAREISNLRKRFRFSSSTANRVQDSAKVRKQRGFATSSFYIFKHGAIQFAQQSLLNKRAISWPGRCTDIIITIFAAKIERLKLRNFMNLRGSNCWANVSEDLR